MLFLSHKYHSVAPVETGVRLGMANSRIFIKVHSSNPNFTCTIQKWRLFKLSSEMPHLNCMCIAVDMFVCKNLMLIHTMVVFQVRHVMIVEMWEGQAIACNHRCDVRYGPCTRGVKRARMGRDEAGNEEAEDDGAAVVDGMEEEVEDSDPEYDEEDLKAGGAASKVTTSVSLLKCRTSP